MWWRRTGRVGSNSQRNRWGRTLTLRRTGRVGTLRLTVRGTGGIRLKLYLLKGVLLLQVCPDNMWSLVLGLLVNLCENPKVSIYVLV